MGWGQTIKEVVELVQKTDNIDLVRKILTLQTELGDLGEERQKDKERIRELEAKVKTKESLRYEAPFYFLPNDSTPICSSCWDTKELVVRLPPPVKVAEGPRYDCPSCKNHVVYPRDPNPNYGRVIR